MVSNELEVSISSSDISVEDFESGMLEFSGFQFEPEPSSSDDNNNSGDETEDNNSRLRIWTGK